jgi:Domain of unknown function (DUF4129)
MIRPRFAESLLAGLLLTIPGVSIAAFAQSGLSDLRASPSLTVSALTDELGRISASLRENATPEKMAGLACTLPGQWTVSTNERSYTISTRYLREQLSSGSQENASAWVRNLRSQLASYSSTASGNTANARAELDQILGGPEFAAVRPPSAWDLFRQRVSAWFARLLARLFRTLERYPIGGKILFWFLVVGCVGVIAVWVFRFMISRDRLESLPSGTIARPSRTWQEWIRIAREAAGRADFRDAVHSAYWAAITRLEDEGSLPKDHSKTPREYLGVLSEPAANDLTPRPNYCQPLSVLTLQLEQIWYGNRRAGADDFRDTLQQLEALGCTLE